MSKNPLKHLSSYELRHLASHLAAAACTEDLHRLLVLETDAGRNAWHGRKYAIGDVAGYLEDIDEAWRLTERDASVRYVAAVRCLRYALMVASINSLSETVPPRLMAAAVEKGIWSIEQGLTYARRCPDPKQRVEALKLLAPRCMPQLQHRVFSEVIATASAIENRPERASVLLALTDSLPDDHKLALIHEGLRFADELGPSGVKKLFEAVPVESREELIPALVDIAMVVDDEGRLMILSLLAPILQSDQDQWLKVLKEIVYKIEDHQPLREAADILAKYLSAETIGAVLSSGYKAGIYINPGWVRAFAPYADKQALREALETVGACAANDRTSYMAAVALGAIAPHLDDDSLRRAFHIAQHLQDANDRLTWLQILAPYADQQALRQTLEAARECAANADINETVSVVLGEIAPHLDEDSLRSAFHIAQHLQDANDRLTWLRIFAPFGDKQALREALETAGACAANDRTSYMAAVALGAIAPHLDDDSLRRAFHIAQHLQDAVSRLSWLQILAPYADQQALRQTLEAARECAANKKTRYQAYQAVKALIDIVPHLDEGSLRIAFDIAQHLQDANDRLSWLRILAPYADQQALRLALEAARECAANKKTRYQAYQAVKALIDIVPHLDEGSLRIAFDIAQHLQDANDRLSWLRILAPCADQHVLRQALEAARECGANGETNYQVVQAFTDIAPHLDEGSLRIAFDIAQHLLNVRQRSRCLFILNEVTHQKDSRTDEDQPDRTYSSTAESIPLNHEMQSAIEPKVSQSKIEAVTTIQDTYQRYVELKKLVPRLAQGVLPGLLSSLPDLMSGSRELELDLLSLTVARLNERDRGHALSNLAALLSQIPGGAARLNEALERLAPYLPEVVLSETLVLSRQIRDSRARNYSMQALLPYLSAEQKEQVLGRSLELFEKDPLGFDLAGVIPHLPQKRTEAILHRIAPYLKTDFTSEQQLMVIARETPPEYQRVFEELVNVAPRFSNKFHRTQLLETLIPKVTSSARDRAIDCWLEIGPRIIDARGLGAVVPHLSEAHLRRLMHIGDEATSTRVRAARLTTLGPFLPSNLVAEALQMARRLDNKADGVNALAQLKAGLPVLDTHASRRLEPNRAREAIDQVREHSADSYVRIQTVLNALPLVPENERDRLIEEAAERTLQVSDALAYEFQVADLWTVAHHISTSLLQRLVAGAEERRVANDTLIDGYRVLAERLPPSEAAKLRSDAAALAHMVDWPPTRKELLERLGRFDETQRARWLLDALGTEPDRAVNNTELSTNKLLPEMSALSIGAQLSVWNGFLRRLHTLTRPNMLARLSERLPLLQVFGGRDWAEQALKAITDAGRWWP